MKFYIQIIFIFSCVLLVQNATINDDFRYCPKTKTNPFKSNELCEKQIIDSSQTGNFTLLEKESLYYLVKAIFV